MRIALIQMDVFAGNEEANRKTALSAIRGASRGGADLVLLPELWNAGYVWREEGAYRGSRDPGDFAVDFASPGGLAADLASAARENGIWVAAGSVPEVAGEGIYNTTAVFDTAGELVHRYRKVHLIGLMDEHRHLVPGEDCDTFDLDGIPTGVFICYDLRFPELARTLFVAGAKLLLVPAQWPSARSDHWRALLIARAIENQCFVAACNRVGQGGPDTFDGGSMVVDPTGEVLVEGDSRPAVLFADLDFDLVERIRGILPCQLDRRPEVYRL
ncbi:MAG: carbon-nitrogen family hydrolase [Bacillota bacterium]